LFKDAVNVTNSSTSSNLNLTFSLKPSNTMFYSGSQSVTLSVFDQYIDTIPEDFSYTYNADNLTASVTGFADPNLIAHMDANRLYIPNTVTNSDDGQTYTITSMSNGFSSTKVGSVYSKFAYEGTFKYLRLPNAIQEMRSNSFNMCLSFTSLLTLPTQLTSFIGSDNIQQCLFYGVYIPNCPLTLQKYSNEGA
jgi:hypothetical protein